MSGLIDVDLASSSSNDTATTTTTTSSSNDTATTTTTNGKFDLVLAFAHLWHLRDEV